MKIQLPVETWIEILDWLHRRDLVKKLDKLWDRQFTPIVQDWLHKYTRNAKLGELWARQDGLHVVWNKAWEEVPFAEVDLPGNVTNFKSVMIRYLDSTLLAFLRRLCPLFQNICLNIATVNEASTQATLQHLMPMFNSNNSSIKTLSLDCKFLPFFSANYPAAFFEAKFLFIWKYASDHIEPMLTWPFTRREDGQPRLLWLDRANTSFYEKIRERFLDPARQSASPFFIRFSLCTGLPNASSVIDNSRTGEQLSVQQYVDKDYGLITNYCPSNVDPNWLAKNTAELLDWKWGNQDRCIHLFTLKIGQLDDDENPGPGTSQTTAAKRMHPANDDEEASTSGGEATSSTGVKRKKKLMSADPKKKEKKANDDEETQGLRRSERIKKMKQSKKN